MSIYNKKVGGIYTEWIPFFINELKNKKIVFITDSSKNFIYFSKFSKNFMFLKEEENISRAIALYKVLSNDQYIVFTTLAAIYKKTTSKEHFLNTCNLKKKENISIINFQKTLVEFGYTRAEVTETKGQFSVRGGIIDVFPITSEFPYRIDFLGNIIENIKVINKETQVSKDNNIENILITNILEKSENATFIDYLSNDVLFIYDFGVFDNYLSSRFATINIQPFQSEGENFAVTNDFKGNIRSEKGLVEFLDEVKKYEKSVISVSSIGAKRIVSEILPTDQNIQIINTPLSLGFIRNNLAIYTEKELFGYILRSSYKQLSKKNIFKNYSGLLTGNYVVHKKHGVAIFNGIVTINIDGVAHDFLELIYKDADKLFLPVENIDLITRYGASDETHIECDKLGGVGWNNRYEKVKKKILIIADNLLQTAAKRKVQQVPAIEVNEEKYEKFIKDFPYIETDDQVYAINDVIKDLKSGVPMDRLVCGDVGFGKTEVALRASYLVASSNKQVVLLAPTTILVEQHYKNFKKRFEKTEINIGKLSRFLSTREYKENLEKIKNGEIKLIITTHAILSNKIEFKDLGMLIIDEEQHFGVKQKEFIKSLRADIHILTLTATPIPRTLQMAISGIRSLSIIASPPPDRFSVRTYISKLTDEAIKKAIYRELDRKGQVFVVSPRIEFLEGLYKMIKALVPEHFRIGIAHGKSLTIEKTINDFCNGDIDILISTNIVDSGIDIQNANTILIDRADMFGLSQLYQLRGRVGRESNVQAFAYMCIPDKITEIAKKRLEIIEKLDELGSGFTLSSYDLEVRGAGNIVGEEQSGYIREVGIELYQNMLERAISMKENDDISPQINIGLPVLIPSYYITENNLRISMYRRIGDLKTHEDVDNMKFELIDRFGPLPSEVLNLLNVIRIKIDCIKANIDKIEVGKNGVTISFSENVYKNREKLMTFLNDNKEIMKLRPDHKIIINKRWNSVEERTLDVMRIIKFLGI